jgi:Fur family transcriptional regulator, peroxide stress response regulator
VLRTLNSQEKETLHSALKRNGLRPTKQRASVYKVILGKKDHPNAEEILQRVRLDLPTISMATVYNCLETLVACGLVRQVNLDRSPSRFCPNLRPHAHFECTKTGAIFDLDLNKTTISTLEAILPKGFSAESFDLSFIGSSEGMNRNKLHTNSLSKK